MPWIREWLPTPVFLPCEFHGQKSLAGLSEKYDLFNLLPHLPTLFYKRNWHPDPKKMVLRETGSPSSQPAGFPYKVVDPCP